jgi:hypothetical protein
MNDKNFISQAKSALKAKYEKFDWFRGAGIALSGSDFHLRLNVASTIDKNNLPDTFWGIPVDIIVIDKISARDI